MQSRQLGQSSISVSPVIFGAWAIGGWMWGGNEESDSLEAIRAAIDHGITTIDTAAIYGQGYSEELVGKAIAGRRDKVIIATKCGMRWNSEVGSDPWKQKDVNGKEVTIRRNGKADSIAYECEQSLKRLKTDVIDLYQIHWPDLDTPTEETIGALDRLRQAGKVRAIGVSNYNVEWLRRASDTATIASDQPPYSVLRRGIENDVLPFCRERKIGVICYSPMERGLLTGKVGPERVFGEGDHRAKHAFFAVEIRKRVLAALEKIRPIADKHRATFAQVIVNWTFSQPGITAAIVGARNAEQAAANAGAMGFVLSGEELGEIRSTFDSLAGDLAKK